jgi:hypothetical protein
MATVAKDVANDSHTGPKTDSNTCLELLKIMLLEYRIAIFPEESQLRNHLCTRAGQTCHTVVLTSPENSKQGPKIISLGHSEEGISV